MTETLNNHYISIHTDFHLFFNLYEKNIRDWNEFSGESVGNISNILIHDILQKIRFNLISAVINLAIGIESYFRYWVCIIHPLKKIQLKDTNGALIDASIDNKLTSDVDELLKTKYIDSLIKQFVPFIKKHTKEKLICHDIILDKLEALFYLRNEIVHGSAYRVNDELEANTQRVFKNYKNNSPLKNLLEVTNNAYMYKKRKNITIFDIQDVLVKEENKIKEELLNMVNKSILELNDIKDIFTQLREEISELSKFYKFKDIHNDCILALDSSSFLYKPIIISSVIIDGENDTIKRKQKKKAIKDYFKEHYKIHNLTCGEDGNVKLELQDFSLESLFYFPKIPD